MDQLFYLHVSDNLEDTTINKDLAERILVHLKEEPQRSQDIFIMRFKGYSHYEIGLKHKISESSARVINHRLKNKIKNILEMEGLGDE